MTRTTQAKQHIVIGLSELVIAGIAVICGIVAVSKISSPILLITIGLWALYYAVPGSLCIFAGFRSNSITLGGLVLATNIIGTVMSGIALLSGAICLNMLNTSCDTDNYYSSGDSGDGCYCLRYHFEESCDDVYTVKGPVATATIMHLLLMGISFIGSIFGCIGTCCAPRQPTVVVTTGAIPNQPNMVAMTTETTGYAEPPSYTVQAYPPQQAYPGGVVQQQTSPLGVVLQQAYLGGVAYPGAVIQGYQKLAQQPGGELSTPGSPGNEVKAQIQ